MPQITVYSTGWCGWCRRLRAALHEAQIDFHEIDIDADPAAAGVVTALNGGNRTVPTVVFPDGHAVVNPSVDEVRERLAQRATA